MGGASPARGPGLAGSGHAAQQAGLDALMRHVQAQVEGVAAAAAVAVLLLGFAVADLQRDRVGRTRAFALEHGVHVCLKGSRSVVASPDGRVLINPTGNPGMASGGTGDVLTGIVGGLLARGPPRPLTPGN